MTNYSRKYRFVSRKIYLPQECFSFFFARSVIYRIFGVIIRVLFRVRENHKIQICKHETLLTTRRNNIICTNAITSSEKMSSLVCNALIDLSTVESLARKINQIEKVRTEQHR